jgi:hypothetical protein
MVAINSLKGGYYTTYIASACVNDATQTSFDAHVDTFKALLVHAKVLVTDLYHTSSSSHNSHPEAAANFTFDIVLVPPLFYTALRCRCPTTRREAIALLSQNLPREGLWDPEKHRIVAERVIETEEKDVDERGWPLERARLWNGTAMTDIDEKSRSEADFLLAKENTAGRMLIAPDFMASSTSLTIGHGPPIPTIDETTYSDSAYSGTTATTRTSSRISTTTTLPAGWGGDCAVNGISKGPPSVGQLYLDVPVRRNQGISHPFNHPNGHGMSSHNTLFMGSARMAAVPSSIRRDAVHMEG